jgi:hemoglobin-like flavoprotein
MCKNRKKSFLTIFYIHFKSLNRFCIFKLILFSTFQQQPKRMFESNEELKKYFEKLKDKDNATLLKSQILLDHATVVMEAIDTTVTELDDAEKTHNNLKKMGVEHKARGIAESHLSEIRTPFLKAIEETLGDRYSDRMRNIYEIFIDYVIKTMKEGYNS